MSLAVASKKATNHASLFRPELLEDLAAEGLETACMDVTNSSSVTTAVDDILAREGHIDICVANAGEHAPYGNLQRHIGKPIFSLLFLCMPATIKY